MKKVDFNEALNQLIEEDPRYEVQAYHFLREGLDFTITHFSKPVEGPGRHVSGSELLEGIRKYALQEYGPLTKTVLEHWGIRQTSDFGHLVFNLVRKGVLGKTEEDSLGDFDKGYNFDDAFCQPFQPREQKMPETSPITSADDTQ